MVAAHEDKALIAFEPDISQPLVEFPTTDELQNGKISGGAALLPLQPRTESLSMPPPSRTGSGSNRTKQLNFQKDLKELNPQLLPALTAALKEPRNSLGSQGSIESPGIARQSAGSDGPVLQDSELDESRLLALFGILTSPTHSSASAGPAPAGEVVDSERKRSSNDLLDTFISRLASPKSPGANLQAQDLASFQRSAPKTLSLLAELRPNASTIIAQLASAAPQATPAATPPQLTGFPPSAPQNFGGQRSQHAVQSPISSAHGRPFVQTEARQIVQTEGQLPTSSSMAHFPPPQASGTAGKPPPMSRAALASGKDSKELATILESKELNARQEAALLAHCSAGDKGLSVIAPAVDKIREDSMLAGLGVIAPNEIGASKQSKSQKARSGRGLLAELRQQKQPQSSQQAQLNAEALRRAPKQQLPNAAAQASIPGREAANRAQMSNEGVTHFAMRDDNVMGQAWPQGQSPPLLAGSAIPRASFSPAPSYEGRAGLLGAGRPLLDGHSPLLEFGSGNLAAKAAGQDLPQLGTSPAAQLSPYSSADLQSPRGSSIVSRASSPALSSFGSGNIASGIARGSSLQSRHSSPVRLGSGSALSGGGEGGSGQLLLRSPPSALPRQSSGNPPVPTQLPTTLERLSSAQAFQDSRANIQLSVLSKRSLSPDEDNGKPRKKILPIIPQSIFSREDAPGWRPPPSPPENTGSAAEDPNNSRFWTVHSLNSWANGDRNMLQSARSSLHSRSSIQSQPSFHSWAGPGSGLGIETPTGSRIWSKVNNSGTLEFIRQPSPLLGDATQFGKDPLSKTNASQQSGAENLPGDTIL